MIEERCPECDQLYGLEARVRELEQKLEVKSGALEFQRVRATAMSEQLAAVTQKRDTLQETLASSEEYRRAYQAGKMALYSMGSPFTEAAMEHLPCGEGALDRRFTKLIEMPRIAQLQAINKELVSELEMALGGKVHIFQPSITSDKYCRCGYHKENIMHRLADAALTHTEEEPACRNGKPAK